MKFSDRFNEDWEFYLANASTFSFFGGIAERPPMDPNGLTAKEAFHRFDSTGKLAPCREPDLFQRAITCKKSVNFHVKLWAEGAGDTLQTADEFMEEFQAPPAWVREALRGAMIREELRRVAQL